MGQMGKMLWETQALCLYSGVLSRRVKEGDEVFFDLQLTMCNIQFAIWWDALGSAGYELVEGLM